MSPTATAMLAGAVLASPVAIAVVGLLGRAASHYDIEAARTEGFEAGYLYGFRAGALNYAPDLDPTELMEAEAQAQVGIGSAYMPTPKEA